MDIDDEKTAEITLTVLSLSAHGDGPFTRAWKGIDWDALDLLYQREWISNPVGKSKSVALTDKGLAKSAEFKSKYLSRTSSDTSIHTQFVENISAKAQILVRSKPSVVFDAFVDADTMSKFWFARRDQGLKEGEEVLWYIGKEDDAQAIEIRVKEMKKPKIIRIEWGSLNEFTEVLWFIEATADGNTKLSIEESGFTGSYDDVVKKALDSTCGFNQVIVALKALLEHGTSINVVTDHCL